MKHHASGFAIGLMLLLASSVTAQQKAQRNPSQLLPENFPEVFEKIVQASKTGFATIKGAPMLGEEHAQATTKVYDFKWKTVVLPGATNCTIVQSQISDAQGKGKVTLSLGYQCQMNVDADQLIKGVRAGLGPGWSSAPCGSPEELAKRPEWKNDSCFCLDNDPDPKARLSQSGGLGCLRRVFIEHTERGLELAVASYNYDGLPQGAETEDDVSAAIERIQNAQHSQLPPIKGGSGGGAVTVQNDTQSVLIVYFSGETNLKTVVPPNGRTRVSLNAGTYKVAGELSDKSALPFFGVRQYSGGETEEFYIAPR